MKDHWNRLTGGVKDKVLEGNPVLDGDAVPGKRSDSFTCILVPHDGS
jgi:hypothetical protein